MSLKHNKTIISSKELKKYKSLSNDNFISNKSSKLHSFFTSSDKYKDFELTYIPYKTYLYQGTDFDFENDKKTIEDYYKYYNKKHNGAYFLSSEKIASLYGSNKDFSIVYITIPSNKEIENPLEKNKNEYIYPMYYIKGNEQNKGVNIKYTLNKNLILLDIGNLKNLIFIWNLIYNYSINSHDKNVNIFTLYKTCSIMVIDMYNKPPEKVYRNSNYKNDNDLILLFLDFIIPIFKSIYNINIDGWIYKGDNINNEILLINNKSLIFKNKTNLSINLYKDLLSIDEFKESMRNKKIENNDNIKPNTILSNFN